MLLLADAYIGKGDDADAEVLLKTLIDNKVKQEYIDEAFKRLETIKARQKASESTRMEAQNKDMKVEYNQTKSDGDLFDKMLEDLEKQKQTVPTQTINQQPK